MVNVVVLDHVNRRREGEPVAALDPDAAFARFVDVAAGDAVALAAGDLNAPPAGVAHDATGEDVARSPLNADRVIPAAFQGEPAQGNPRDVFEADQRG